MGPPIVPELVQILPGSAGSADAGVVSRVIAEAVPGWIAVIAFASSVAVLVAMPIVALLWWRGSITRRSRAPIDPEAAGVFAVVFVTRENGDRWIPATVLRLALQGVLTVVDHGLSSSESTPEPAPRRVYLELRADHSDLVTRASAGEIDAAVAIAMFEGRSATGSQVPARRTPTIDARLAEVARAGLARARRAYLDRIPAPWLRAFETGALVGVVGGLVSLGLAPPTASGDLQSVSGLAITFGLVGLIGRLLLLSRLKSLDAAGVELRERSAGSRLFSRIDESIEGAERCLPWAVLYRRRSVVSRYAERAERSAIPPTWYRSEDRFSASRFTGCLSALENGYTLRSHKDDATDDLALFDGGGSDRPWYWGPWW